MAALAKATPPPPGGRGRGCKWMTAVFLTVESDPPRSVSNGKAQQPQQLPRIGMRKLAAGCQLPQRAAQQGFTHAWGTSFVPGIGSSLFNSSWEARHGPGTFPRPPPHLPNLIAQFEFNTISNSTANLQTSTLRRLIRPVAIPRRVGFLSSLSKPYVGEERERFVLFECGSTLTLFRHLTPVQ